MQCFVIWCVVSHASAVVYEGLPHDLMLASDREVPAGKLLAWLRTLKEGAA